MRMDELAPNHDRGLAFDLATLSDLRQRMTPLGIIEGRRLMDRRRVIKLIGSAGLGAGLLAVFGCGDDNKPAAQQTTQASSATPGTRTATAVPATATTAANATCDTIPEETAGPFPGDGSNGPNVLAESGIVRSDLRSSFGSASGVAEGVPLTIKMLVEDKAKGCARLAGAAVYVWHCDREGRYSLYSQGVTNENYLRGVQVTDGAGLVTFSSIFPACYSGRWPHIHFEVYPSVDTATNSANTIATSQIALPQDACATVFETDGYSQSVRNLSQVSLTSDNVFGDDGGVHQLGKVTGSVAQGFVVELTVPVEVA